MPSDDSRSHRRMSARANKKGLKIGIVAALDEQRVVGRGGELPWRLPADLRHFKAVTMGHPIIMGRLTYESIGKPLPGRLNIVLSRQPAYEAPGCVVAASLEQAFDEAGRHGAEWAMVIGGHSLFREALPLADALFLTVVHGQYEGDTYFPDFDGTQWKVVEREHRSADERNEAAMTFVELRPTCEPPRTVGNADRPGPLPGILGG